MREKINLRWTAAGCAVFLSLIAVWCFLPIASSQNKIPKDSGSGEVKKNFENYDIRDINAEGRKTIVEPAREKLSAEKKEEISGRREKMEEAERRLNAKIDNLEVKYNEDLGAPEIVDAGKGGEFLTPASTKNPERIVRDFMTTNRSLYGLTTGELAQFETRAVYTNPDGKITWVSMERKIHGLPVFRGEVTAALTRKGELVRTVGELTSGLEERGTPPATPAISAAQAVAAAAESIGVAVDPMSLVVKETSANGATVVFERGPFSYDIKAELQYFPLATGIASLSWGVQLVQNVPAYYIIVSAEKGDLYYRKNAVNEQTQPATYNIYNDDSPAPLSPTNSVPGTPVQGAAIGRTNFTLISELASSDPWLADGATTTTGNNVDSGMDLVAPDGIDAGSRPVSATRNFNFNYNPAPGIPGPGDDPALADYRFGEAVNMFFWTNRWHDRMYQLGFTEAARNFQTNNYGRGGSGNDAVLAQGQDFSGTDNANFLTLPDGTPGRMQMYRFTGPNPDRSSGLDQEILIHELTHGTSNRLHNNANGLNATMSGGMGEGWSDFYALSLLSKPTDNVNGVYAVGGYSTIGIVGGFVDNYYYGIRRFPHARISVLGANGKPHNPLTFADIDPTQINLTDGAFPRGPIGAGAAFQVHNIGEVWCAALWEVRGKLIDLYGPAAGNQRMLQLVTDGMKLDPANPTLIDGRNSILAASAASGGGAAEEAAIWSGFAMRGLGFFASAVGATSSSVVENFDTPNLLLGNVRIYNEDCLEPNNAADPGETVTLEITINNPLGVTANNTTVSIVGGGSDSTARPIPAFGSEVFHATYTVPASAQCGDVINLTIQINSSLGPTTKTYALQIGAPTSLGAGVNNSTGNIAVAIPDSNTVEIPINVPQSGRVGDVNVKVRLNHSFDGDLVLSIVAPDGTVVPLANNRGGSGDNYGSGANDCSGTFTVFDAQAGTAIGAGTAPFAGSFRPDGNLALLNGKQMNGTWKLRVADTAALDTGTVGCAQIELTEQRYYCCGVPGTPDVIAVPPPTVVNENRFRANGVPDPGERLSMRFPLKNIGSDLTTNLVATLLPGGGVSMPGPAQSYGVLNPAGPAVAKDFALTVNGACGATVTATFQLQDGPLNLGTVSFPFRLGTPFTGGTSASNSGSMTIPGTGTGAASGAPANPYPSAINVAGITGTVTKVRVTINGFSHTFPADADILLVGPGGQTALLMSDVGGGTDAVNATLTFDDAAAPIGTTVVSGTFQPTNIGTGDLFPAPAPAGPYGNSALSVFNGVNPNGTWSLYVVDDAGIDAGSISGGWSLTFTTLDYVCP